MLYSNTARFSPPALYFQTARYPCHGALVTRGLLFLIGTLFTIGSLATIGTLDDFGSLPSVGALLISRLAG